MSNYPEIEKRFDLTPEDFLQHYAGKKAVVLCGLTDQWKACHTWTKDYFYKIAGKNKIECQIFQSDPSQKRKDHILLKDYVSQVLNKKKAASENTQWYFHDRPLPTLLDALRFDLEPFPLDYFPKWYRRQWWKNLFFFSTDPGTLIPLHFDPLGTHNTYFHLRGKKKFIIIAPEYIEKCYMHDYNLSRVNPEEPDFHQYPLFKKAEPKQIFLSPGEILYLPPYTLHQVKSLDACMSVKVDWHTPKSAISSFKNLSRGISATDAYYNFIFALGVVLKIPSPFLYSFYKKSLSRLRYYDR